LIFFIFSAAFGNLADDLVITFRPIREVFYQGDIIMVKIFGRNLGDEIKIECYLKGEDRENKILFLKGNQGEFIALIGLDLHAKPGNYKIIIYKIYGNRREKIFEKKILIKQLKVEGKPFELPPLSLEKSFKAQEEQKL